MSLAASHSRVNGHTVVDGLLAGSDLGVELVVATVVDTGDAKGEPSRDRDTKGQLALLPVGADGDTRAGLSVELTEGHSNRGLVGWYRGTSSIKYSEK